VSPEGVDFIDFISSSTHPATKPSVDFFALHMHAGRAQIFA
jgi:hypothetical protein